MKLNKDTCLATLKWAHDEVDAISLDKIDNDTKQACKACIAVLIEAVKCDLVDVDDVLGRYTENQIPAKRRGKMKYYKLKKDLPTYNEGELFYTDDNGSIIRVEDDLMAYYHKTVSKFPNILKDWFEEVPVPERDEETKHAFVEYLNEHREERFFQAIRNFAGEYLGDYFSFIYSSKRPLENYLQHYDGFIDTFYLECDSVHEAKDKEV